MRYKKALLIANPFSRRFEGSVLKKIIKNVRKRGIELDIEIIGEHKKGSNDYDLVLVNGGDASVNFAANIFANSRTAILVLPSGTSDVYALEASIPRDPLTALKLIERGIERKITLGNLNGRYFVQMAGIGFDAVAVRMVDERLKKITGKFAYIISALRSLKSNNKKIKFDIDDRQIEGYSAIIGNGRRYGGWFSAVPEASLFSETLDMVIFKRRFAFEYVASVLLSRRSKDAFYLKANRILVEQAGVDVHIDGDWICKTPVEITSMPEALTVLIPEQKGENV